MLAGSISSYEWWGAKVRKVPIRHLAHAETRHRGTYLHSVRPPAPLEKALKGPADLGALQRIMAYFRLQAAENPFSRSKLSARAGIISTSQNPATCSRSIRFQT
jgi:hypothetical protein